jgi:hypothetical protein
MMNENKNKRISQTRREIHVLARKQDELYEELKHSLCDEAHPKLTTRAEDFLFDYIFNTDTDDDFMSYLNKIFKNNIPFEIYEK